MSKQIINNKVLIQPSPVLSFAFAKGMLIHMRPYLMFISGVAGLAGMALASEVALEYAAFAILFLPFFLGYGFGQALTDCFQIDTDAISSPYRPLVKGEISVRSVLVVSLLGLLGIGAVLISFNLNNILWAVLTIAGLATYTYFKKNFWFAGPFYNAWIVMLLPIMGYMVVSGTDLQSVWGQKLYQLMGLSFFSYANFVLIGYLKDITADRSSGYHTFPVRFGWDAAVWVGDAFALLGIVFCWLAIQPYELNVSLLAFVAASIIAIAGQLYAHLTKIKKEENSAFPISATVRSFILWHIAVILAYRPNWLLFCLAFYLLFECVLFFRPEKNQI
ncbi:MAG: UbiA family prenyltransferase [Bacteroidota bacterium]